VPAGNDGCEFNTTARSFASCTEAGCHSSPAIASNALSSLRVQLALFADILWIDTDNDETIDAAPLDGGLLAIIKRDFPGAINPSDNVISPADGAEFNVKLFGEDRYENGDKSFGVHNPFLAKALLAANIAELQATYPGLPTVQAEVKTKIDAAISAVYVRQPGLRMAGHTSSRPK